MCFKEPSELRAFSLTMLFFRFSRTKVPFDLSILKHFLNSMSLYFALQTVENNKNKKSVKFQGDMLNFYDFIQVFVFTTNHHLKGERDVAFIYYRIPLGSL